MELLSIDSNILSIFAVIILTWFSTTLLSYLKEKSKKQASKEDFEKITSLVESVKKSNSIEIEKIKSSLSNEDKLLEKKREVYEQIASSLRIFISGQSSEESDKNAFHSAYSKAWLWSPDPVLAALNKFLSAQIVIANRTDAISQTKVRQLYEDILMAMRKDVGFPISIPRKHKYKFVKFS